MSLSEIQNNNKQILIDIQSLQKIEQGLINTLDTNTNITTKQQEEIINKINQISKMRMNLYQTLNDVNNYFKHTLTNSEDVLQEQTAAINIVESELSQTKKRIALLEEQNNNKIRLIEINNYYGEKYAEHTTLVKTIVFLLIPIIILSILFNNGFLPKNIYIVLLVIISFIGGIYVITRFLSIWNRDNMNYQKYSWMFSQPSKHQINSEPTSTIDPWAKKTSSILMSCPTQQQQQTSSESNAIKETFINNILTKQTRVYKKPDITLNTFVNPSNALSYKQ